MEFKHRKLSMHVSCVNSLTLSSGDGRFLASGGDGELRDPLYSIYAVSQQLCIPDPFIYIWNLHQEDLTRPTCGLIGHKVRPITQLVA